MMSSTNEDTMNNALLIAILVAINLSVAASLFPDIEAAGDRVGAAITGETHTPNIGAKFVTVD